jgi:ketosteroid isomerase-like protein
MGYVVQRERIDFTPPGAEPTTREYRVTMVFRREPEGWRIVHRHADPQVSRTPPLRPGGRRAARR